MNILKSYSYCIFSFYSSIECKIENSKTTLKLLYIIDYLLLNHTKSDVNL